MTARGTVTVTADTLEDARRQTAETIAQFTPRWRAVHEWTDPDYVHQGGGQIVARQWTVTTTWTEGDA